jgi:hypothetical protein
VPINRVLKDVEHVFNVSGFPQIEQDEIVLHEFSTGCESSKFAVWRRFEFIHNLGRRNYITRLLGLRDARVRKQVVKQASCENCLIAGERKLRERAMFGANRGMRKCRG